MLKSSESYLYDLVELVFQNKKLFGRKIDRKT